MTKVIVITGSRGWRDTNTALEGVIEARSRFAEDVIFRHGGARGADSVASQMAELMGWPTELYSADWGLHGTAAGMVRNRRMLLEPTRADLVVAFNLGSPGTQNMITLAQRYHVELIVKWPRQM